MENNFNLDSFKLNKNYVIEASAGTGKTYNIVQIVKKLVKKYKLRLGEILIVTYTDKAAGELKDRIRSDLEGEDVDNAPIYTIHSFCQNTIKEFGISASLPLNMAMAGDDELADFVNRYLRQGKIANDIINFLDEINFDILTKKLIKGVENYYLNNLNSEDKSIIELNKEVLDISDEIYILYNDCRNLSFEELIEKYSDIKENYWALKNADNQKCNELAECLSKSYRRKFKIDGTKFKSSNKEFKAGGPYERQFRFFASLRDKFEDFTKNIEAILATEYLPDLYIAFQKEKENKKEQTFADMIRFVREAVVKPKSLLNEKLRQKYKYAIIDEFQDTNQLQFDIFSSVFLCEGHNIIVVGDPKQSIYSFQGADINVYYQAKEKIKNNDGIICSLNKNYRSSASMVASCNELFKYYNFAGTDFEGSKYLTEKIDGQEHTALFKNTECPAFWISELQCSEYDFAHIAVTNIVECCKKDESGKTNLQVKDKSRTTFRNVSFRDFCVLARSRSEMLPLANALKEAGIPFVQYKDTSLYNGKECADWIILFNALNVNDLTGKNHKLFKKTLFTRFFGKTLNQAADPVYDNDDNEPLKLIKKWRQLVLSCHYEDLIDDILNDSGIRERLSSLSQMQSLGIYKQIGDMAVDYLSDNHNLDDLIKKLSDLSNHLDDDEDGNLVSKTTNFDAVQIMTMHASKGLQFPVVIAACGFKGDPGNDVITYHKEDDNHVSHHYLNFNTTKNELFDNESYEEKKRLYYVAYTRAQFVMILPQYGNMFNKDFEFLGDSLVHFMSENTVPHRLLENKISDMSSLKGEVSKILSSSEIKDDSKEKEAQEKVLKSLIDNEGNASVFKHSYSSLSHNEEEEDEDNKEGDSLTGLSRYDKKGVMVKTDLKDLPCSHDLKNYPRGAASGTALHEIFELSDFTDYQNNLDKLIIYCFDKQGITLSEDNLKITETMVDDVLNASLPVIHGNKKEENQSFTLHEIPLKDRKSEIEFNFNLLNEHLKNYCNGFMDLLFVRGDYFSILDWKSDTLNDEFTSYNDADTLKKHIDEAYSIQRVLYSYCLIKWLKQYYPSLSEEEIFNQHFGGIYYVLLHGCIKGTGNGIYAQTWNSYKDLEDDFNGIITSRIWRK